MVAQARLAVVATVVARLVVATWTFQIARLVAARLAVARLVVAQARLVVVAAWTFQIARLVVAFLVAPPDRVDGSRLALGALSHQAKANQSFGGARPAQAAQTSRSQLCLHILGMAS